MSLNNSDISIIYYQGHVVFSERSSDNQKSLNTAHGTLYHDLAFEGVIHTYNQTFHLEAVDRYIPENRSYSVLYETDDLYKHEGGVIDFSEIHDSEDGVNYMPHVEKDYRFSYDSNHANR